MIVEELRRRIYPRLTELRGQSPSTRSLIDVNNIVDRMAYPFDDKNLIIALCDLVRKVGGNIDIYEAIFSDDSSGRLPSLLFYRLANKRRQTQELPNIPLYFLNGGRYFEKPPSYIEPGIKRGLIVTEYIYSGKGIRSIMNVLSNMGIAFDTAVVSTSPQRNPFKFKNSYKFEGKVFVGETKKKSGLRFCRQSYETAGVINFGDHPHPYPSYVGSLLINYYSPQKVARARQDIAILAEEFEPLLPPLTGFNPLE